MSATKMQFRRIASSKQLIIDKASDLRHVLALDEALWAVNGMPTDAVIFNNDFLNYMDVDKNLRIRPAELKNAITWLLATLKSYHGIDQASSAISIDDLNLEDSQDAREIADCINLLMNNLGRNSEKVITLGEISSKDTLYLNTALNGDGVIIAEHIEDEAIKAYVMAIEKSEGAISDVSQNQGIDLTKLTQFSQDLAIYLDWQNQAPVVFSASLVELLSLFQKLTPKFTEFFNFCELANYNLVSNFKFDGANINGYNIVEVNQFFANAPLGELKGNGLLSLEAWINPLYKDDFARLLSLVCENNFLSNHEVLTYEDFEILKNKLTPLIIYYNKKPNSKFDSYSNDLLVEWSSNGVYQKTLDLINQDLKVSVAINAFDKLKKLIIYQNYMIEFVNNYVNLERLFDPHHHSLIQPGYVVLDGRHFSLVNKVTNLDEHKKIISRSNICVIYVEVSSGIVNNAAKKILAVAITAGTMRNIFVGKTGIFISLDKQEFDVKIIDLIQQPVSIKEALQAPFFKFGEFSSKQADRFFSLKSQQLDKNVSSDISSGNLIPNITDSNNNKTNIPMLLMGGGVGLAALGSAFAFIANTLKNVSIWNILAVFAGVLLIISAPILLVSLTKLYNRCVSDFLAASSWAINPKMRLSNRMSLIFSHAPKLPKTKIIIKGGDVINGFFKKLK